jgi:hypoxanthine phosphoribosyltransferase
MSGRSDTHPRVLITADVIQSKVEEIANRIAHDYDRAGELVLVGALKGAYVFLADLSRALRLPHLIDFVSVSSYGSGTESGEVRMIMDARVSLHGRHVIIVDDILDTGHTLHHLRELLGARGPASLATAVLLRKPERIEAAVEAEYVGFVIPDVWVVGYGLDLAERFRMLPYVGELSASEAAAVMRSGE